LKRNFRRNGFLISTDKDKLQPEVIHKFLKTTYWAAERPLKEIKKSIRTCLCFGVYHKGKQVGFARVLTDYIKVGYIADVFIIEEYRGKGLSKWLMEVILSYGETKNVIRWMLHTRNAQSLYRRYGFGKPKKPKNYMEMVIQNK
jgi:GNAT superfamily N-acetyltransferase